MATLTNVNARVPSKRQILFFLLGTAILTAILDLYIIREVKTVRHVAIIFLMWIPGLVAVGCSNFFGNKYRDLALIKPGKTSMLYAYIIPAVCAVLTLVVLVLMDIGKLRWPVAGIFKTLIVQPVLGVAVSFILAAGEELGWRGYLHTHLMRARVPEPILVTGLIWSMWHWPLILWADYSTSSMPWLSLMLFTICLTSFSVILGWLREFSKSLFPCALAHACHNTWVQSIYPDFYTPGRLDPFFGGESGFVLAIIYLVIAMYLYRYHIATTHY